MVSGTLEEKEQRVADARRKLAWYLEEYRELQRSPVFKDYFRLAAKHSDSTSEEKARLAEVRKTQESLQYVHNLGNRNRTLEELRAAEKDLQAYRRMQGIVPISKQSLVDRKSVV